jgi:putative hydrolase of the HAD superfamily
MARIDAMLMDVGNVMVRLKTRQLFDSLISHCSNLDEALLQATLRDEKEGLHIAYEKGQVDFDAFYADFVGRYGMAYSRAEFLGVWNDYFLPNRPMEALVGRLGRQVRWWGLSNTNQEHHRHFCRAFRVFDVFERVIGSHELGLRKPDPDIFKKALKITGIPAERTLFVDDLERNVDAARSIGLNAFHYQFNDLELQKQLLEYGLELPPRRGQSGMAC